MTSREAIIRQIVDRDLANRDLSEETIRKTERALYEIACEEFGFLGNGAGVRRCGRPRLKQDRPTLDTRTGFNSICAGFVPPATT